MVEDVTTSLPTIGQVRSRRSLFGNPLGGYISATVLPHSPTGPGSCLLNGDGSDVVHEICDLSCEPKYRPGDVDQVE